jgi:CRISPR-associated protein Cas1
MVQKNDRTHFIMNPGKLERRDNNLIFSKAREEGGYETPKTLPVNAFDELYLLAKVELDTEALGFLGDSNIVVHLFNHRHAHKGNFYPNTPNSVNKSGFVLLQQVRAFDTPAVRLHIAAQITRAHLSNAHANLKKYGVHGGFDLPAVLGEVETASDIQTLMGVEGSFKKRYYEAWNGIITDQRSFKFTERSKRPPADKINALISYINTRIYNICLSEIYKTELDPRIGFLHEPNYRALSLHLDLAEIFKPLIGDRLIFTLLNTKQITAKEFTTANGMVRFKPDALKTIEMKMIEAMTRPLTLGNQTTNYRQIIRREANRIKKTVVEGTPYEPYIPE